MNFKPLYTTARVVTAIYRVASTVLLLIYMGRRVASGREFAKDGNACRGSDVYASPRRDGERP